jgi:hypothetical protein
MVRISIDFFRSVVLSRPVKYVSGKSLARLASSNRFYFTTATTMAPFKASQNQFYLAHPLVLFRTFVFRVFVIPTSLRPSAAICETLDCRGGYQQVEYLDYGEARDGG